MRLLPYGADALLIELGDPLTVPGTRAALAALPEVREAVAGACTVLVTLADGGADAVRRALAATTVTSTAARDTATVDIPVVYDGADLDAVAELTALSPNDVIAQHTGADYTVRFCGFSPGFAYLDGLPECLQVPRRAEPRTAVPAGAVAIAGPFAGVYPRASPGGWQLLGRTDLTLWDTGRDPPALLTPGTRVRFLRT